MSTTVISRKIVLDPIFRANLERIWEGKSQHLKNNTMHVQSVTPPIELEPTQTDSSSWATLWQLPALWWYGSEKKEETSEISGAKTEDDSQ